MDEPSFPTPPSPLNWRQRFLSPRLLTTLAAVLVAAAVIHTGIQRFYTKPRIEASRRIYQATMDMWALYDLQMANKRSAGTYINGLDALLATTKDGPAIKARMAGYIDLNTATVVGNAERFKIELNVLDKNRTLVRMKGPIGKRLWTKQITVPIPERSASDGMGAPIAR